MFKELKDKIDLKLFQTIIEVKLTGQLSNYSINEIIKKKEKLNHVGLAGMN